MTTSHDLASDRPTHKVRFVTAASLFDGHDAAINIMRRILQGMGAEVIHLGHNRSVDEVVTAALQEDVQGIAVSSYQGGHVEYFQYMVQLLRERGGAHIQVFGGGGGVIVPAEIRQLASEGVRIYSPEDGQRMGLAGMIGEMVQRCDLDFSTYAPTTLAALQGEPHSQGAWRALSQLITALENGKADAGVVDALRQAAQAHPVPVIGITGTGGAGKSSLTDELIRRFRLDQDDRLRIAVISIDPSRRKSGGALLGDRIRMNAISPWSAGPRVYMRSLATRDTGSEISAALPDVIAACRATGFDLIIVETSGIGQGDAAIVPHVDVPMYVMTPEFGAASQLEKIDMLDFAEFVAINKFDRKHEPGKAMLVPMLSFALLCLLCGVVPQLPLRLAAPAIELFYPPVASIAASPEYGALLGRISFSGVLLCIVAIAVTLLWRWRLGRSRVSSALTWGCRHQRGTANPDE